LAWRNPAEWAAVLEDTVAIMEAREAAMHGVSRLHIPTKDQPMIVVFVDELASLLWVSDRDVKRRIDAALGVLLSRGRACAISVVGCVQDPRKETVPARGLYTVRVVLAVNESGDVELVLNRGAYDRGAQADKIPDNMRGVGFVEVDRVSEPVRVRFCHVTDDHIQALCGGWRPPSVLPDLDDEAA
jgi:S-DNA-T family DNA segregation ATPase FtsK/SpoIIIE